MSNIPLPFPSLRIPPQGVPVSKFILLTVMGLMLLPAGCTATGRNDGQAFPEGYITLDMSKRYLPSPRAERIFAQLKLDRALSINDYEGILDACNRLLESSSQGGKLSSSEAIIDASVWLLSHEHGRDAEDLVNRAITAMPDDLPLVSLYADMLIQQNRSNEAMDLLREFSQKHPEDGQAQAELAVALLRGGDADQAMKIFRKIPQKQLTPQIRFAYAQSLNISRHFQEAEQQLSAAVKAEPEYAEAWQLLALTKEELGKKQEALAIYRQLLDTDPSNRSARLFLIRLQLHEHNMNGAVKSIMESREVIRFAVATAAMLLDEKQVTKAEELLTLLEQQPRAPKELYFYHGALLYENGLDVDKALSFLDKVPPDSSEYDKALRLKASIAYERQDTAQSEKILAQLRELNPDDPDIILMSSELWMHQRDYDKADALLSRAAKDFPSNEQIEFQLAFLRELQGRRDEAMSMMEDIVEKYPDNAFALNYVGYNLAESNRDLDRALQLIEKAITLQPEADFIIDSLAWVYFRRGDVDEAWKQIRKVVQLDDQTKETDPTMLEHYGDIAMAMDLRDEAIQAWKEAETMFLRLGDKEAASRIRSKLEKNER